MFEVICKKVTFFETICEIDSYKFTSFYVQGQLVLVIRIQDHYQTRFNATNSMVALELANELPLKITFFEISNIVLICMKL